ELRSGRAFEEIANEMDAKLVRAGKRGIEAAGDEIIKVRTPLQHAVANWTAALDYGVDHLSEVPTNVEVPESGDYYVREGMGNFVASFAKGVDVRLGTPVTRVEWNGDGVRVTAGGKVYRAKKIILTLPPAVLASGKIEFVPPLPKWKHEAFAQVPMGHFAKV